MTTRQHKAAIKMKFLGAALYIQLSELVLHILWFEFFNWTKRNLYPRLDQLNKIPRDKGGYRTQPRGARRKIFPPLSVFCPPPFVKLMSKWYQCCQNKETLLTFSSNCVCFLFNYLFICAGAGAGSGSLSISAGVDPRFRIRIRIILMRIRNTYFFLQNRNI